MRKVVNCATNRIRNIREISFYPVMEAQTERNYRRIFSYFIFIFLDNYLSYGWSCFVHFYRNSGCRYRPVRERLGTTGDPLTAGRLCSLIWNPSSLTHKPLLFTALWMLTVKQILYQAAHDSIRRTLWPLHSCSGNNRIADSRTGSKPEL